MKRTLALFLSTLTLLALLTGCGSKAAPRDSAAGSDYMMTNQSYAKTDESFAYDEPELPTPDAENGYWDSGESMSVAQQWAAEIGQKVAAKIMQSGVSE